MVSQIQCRAQQAVQLEIEPAALLGRAGDDPVDQTAQGRYCVVANDRVGMKCRWQV
jgi:hypothetical protein